MSRFDFRLESRVSNFDHDTWFVSPLAGPMRVEMGVSIFANAI
jgi:hypothetical protein